MVTAGTVLEAARSHLNDELGLNWPDQRLFPKLQEAHRELQASLTLAGVPIVNTTSAVINVPAFLVQDASQDLQTGFDASGNAYILGQAGTFVTLTPYQNLNFPSDLVEPIQLFERQMGEVTEDFRPMQEMDFVPDYTRDQYLKYWSWNGEKILMLGATAPNQVKLHYRRELKIPQTNNDIIGVTLGETFLSYKTALLAIQSSDFSSLSNRGLIFLETQADKFLSKIIRINIKEMQNITYKHIPYHRRGANTR